MTLEELLSSEIDIDALAADVCRGSFYKFLQEFWPEIINEAPIWNWHIKYLCDVIQDVIERIARREPALWEYIILNVSPGSSKSTIISVAAPIWAWVVDPSIRSICSSYAGDISIDLADKSRRIFWSDKFKRYFPKIEIDKENEAKSHFKNLTGGERYATSVGSAITGIHAHLLIVDDPINPTQASSEPARITANKFIDETLSTRKVDKLVTATIIVQQRLHEDDTTGHLLASGRNILHICLPAEESDDVKPAELRKYYKNGLFDPIRLNRTAIANLRQQLGSYAASSQLDQRPSPAAGGMLKKEWFEIVDRHVPKNAVIKFKIDTAYTKKQLNDPSGLLAYFMEGNVMYIVNAEEQYLEFPELKKYLPNYVTRHGYSHRSTIKIEPKASGKTVVQELKAETKLNVLEDRVPKDDKVTRANAAAPTCESGRVKLIYGPWNDYFLNQIAAFPNGKHDEVIDNLSSAVEEEFINSRKDYRHKRVN